MTLPNRAAKVGDRPDDGSGPVNDAEQKLLGLLLAAGFAQPQNAMTTHFRRLAKHLIGKDKADEIKNDHRWFAKG